MKKIISDKDLETQIPSEPAFHHFKLRNALRNLRVADLELFITAAHLKNLGQAAALHHLSQSAASAAIQRVEVAFERPLCTHEKRQFRLTKEGQLILPRAENWVRHLHETVATQAPLPIRLLALYRNTGKAFQFRIDQLLHQWRQVFEPT